MYGVGGEHIHMLVSAASMSRQEPQNLQTLGGEGKSWCQRQGWDVDFSLIFFVFSELYNS